VTTTIVKKRTPHICPDCGADMTPDASVKCGSVETFVCHNCGKTTSYIQNYITIRRER
jgi:predicted RNA-binding Zn-ribbon protein involved in translation (DUF1610 family)